MWTRIKKLPSRHSGLGEVRIDSSQGYPLFTQLDNEGFVVGRWIEDSQSAGGCAFVSIRQ